MIRQRHLAIAFLAFLVTPASVTRADVADPFWSTFDSCLRVCPAGDLTFHVLLRTANRSPKPLATVDIEFCQCPGVTLCALTGTESYTIVSGCMVQMVTDANGVADFHIRAGGTCNGAAIRIFADSQLMRTLTAVSSPDQNGDTTVDVA